MLPKSIVISIYLSLLLFLTTGCWDRVEIDQRGFVVGIAIDQPEAADAKHNYLGTFQFVVPGGLKQSTRGSGGGGGGASGKAYFNLSTTENSMPALSGRMSSKTSRSPYFEHLKMILISDKLAKSKSNFADLLDYYLRNSEMRRGVQILITEGKAADVLNIQANNETMPIDYITSIAKNNRKTNFMIPQSRIGDVHENLVKHESFAIQKVKIEDQGISLSGCAIFAGDTKRMVGFLSGAETQGLNFITNQMKGGIVESKIDENTVDFLLERSERKITMQLLGPNRFKFVIQILAEGNLDKSIANIDPSKEQALKRIEKSITEMIEKNAYKAIKKLQQTYKKDALGLGPYLYQNHYKLWKPVENNWDSGDNLFSQVIIEVHAESIIRRIGNINETKKE
ncbi:Ger(x)C family spore germination protein [Paenibacillus sp. SYP-B3998]|uniref:Ger(X)C family spore germination protein n=1 Tax=Paenibacillus sp. SYP-B3998 TaxID=2678564 RepID=A0A6G3ZSH0_9BACL|nr:Ger(x)C family spore germination protein [Paenibacillus sp. SYP-B3998]NEW05153.1 Ger(x)C family spore germination protein [Paenibacillus sp. SYP-B3998]